tara:strand:- start:1843 stop:2037 length:195 start_codon:yes stop_codon:yes gene_type:complete
MRIDITISPEKLQYSAVLTVTNPVKVVADVDVNKAVINGVNSLVLLANGNQRNKVPREIINPKT